MNQLDESVTTVSLFTIKNIDITTEKNKKNKLKLNSYEKLPKLQIRS